jgi:hypothetical protein
MGMLVIVKDYRVFMDKKKKKRNGAKHRQNPREKPGCLLSTRHWEMNSPFSKTTFANKSTLKLLSKKTVKVPERPSYS